jgi:hypothetical protein
MSAKGYIKKSSSCPTMDVEARTKQLHNSNEANNILHRIIFLCNNSELNSFIYPRPGIIRAWPNRIFVLFSRCIAFHFVSVT